MKKQVFQEHSRLGFTLVELLVVISIIGMLAGLLLPAVNAAREAGRRAVCMNNQSQLALALLNYDSAKGNLPPMRGEVGSKIISVTETNYNITSWLGFLMPYMEQVPLYQNLTEVRINATSGDLLYHERQLTRIKSLICPSADVPLVDAGTHYVCNAGYQNATATTWLTTTPTTIAATPGWATRPFEPMPSSLTTGQARIRKPQGGRHTTAKSSAPLITFPRMTEQAMSFCFRRTSASLTLIPVLVGPVGMARRTIMAILAWSMPMVKIVSRSAIP